MLHSIPNNWQIVLNQKCQDRSFQKSPIIELTEVEKIRKKDEKYKEKLRKTNEKYRLNQ